MRRTRKSCGCSRGGRKSRKLNNRKLNNRKPKSRKLNKRKLNKRDRRQRITKVKRGGTGGITSYSAYAAEDVAPQHRFQSLPAEIPVSTTRKELVGNFPFSWMDKKN